MSSDANSTSVPLGTQTPHELRGAMTKAIAVASALAGWVMVAGLSYAQEHPHVADRLRSGQADSKSAAGLSSLLARSDQAVRAIERAAGNDDAPAVVDRADAYAATMEAVEALLDEPARERLTKDLPRVHKALTRQRGVLQRLNERSATGSAEALSRALDANDRALEAVAAAQAAIEPARPEGHHGSQRSHGCGRH